MAVNTERPPISNDLSLYADEIDAMQAAAHQEELENARRQAAEKQQAKQKEQKRNTRGSDENPRTMADAQIGPLGRAEHVEKLQSAATDKTTYLRENPVEKEHAARVAEL